LYQGHLFVNDRLLNESGMERHPLNPMTDPDIRRWLQRQTNGEVGLIPYQIVRNGAAAVADALRKEELAGRRLVVVDALTGDDLRAIGAAVAPRKLLTGGSGIAVGLPDNFRAVGKIGAAREGFTGLRGPGVVLSGSCSTASRGQLAEYLNSHPGFAIDPDALLSGRTKVKSACQFAKANISKGPAIYSTADPDIVQKAQETFGRERIAFAIEAFFAEVARALVDSGVTRLVVGGGETSGAIVTALGLDHLNIGPEIDPGVPALASHTKLGKPLRLALKSGNFGSADFYTKALHMLETE
jgi:uncharacterized protein YgbK (DUF1537 family)